MLYIPIKMAEFQWNNATARGIFDNLRSLPEQEDFTALSPEDLTSYIEGHLDVLIREARARRIDASLPASFLRIGARTLWRQSGSPDPVLKLYRRYYEEEVSPGQKVGIAFEALMAQIAHESETEPRLKVIESTIAFIERHEPILSGRLQTKIHFASELVKIGLNFEARQTALTIQENTPNNILAKLGLDKELDTILQ